MALKIAIQMDAIETVKIDSDTTFALALQAQKRGHTLYYYQVHNLSLDNGQVIVQAQEVSLKMEKGNHFSLHKKQEMPLDRVDVVLMRQDPPFDMNYLSYTYFLDKIKDNILVINDPTEVRNCPEKLFVCDFHQFMPPTLISADKEAINKFFKEHVDIVIKPVYAHGGQDIYKVNADNINKITDKLLEKYRAPVIVQKFLPAVLQGDKRIILIDGEVVGAVNRIPPEGKILSNFVQGGTGEKTTLTKREKEICAALKPELKKRKLILAGIDVIDGYLTEINLTSPTGLQIINKLENTCLEAKFWDVVEGMLV